MNTRRSFIQIVPLAGLSLLAACSDKAAAPASAPTAAPAPAPQAVAPAPAPTAAPAPAAADMPMVAATDPVAVSLGYVAVATQADVAKFPNYAAGLACSNCALFQGKPGDAAGPCPLFAGKQVSSGGWCSSHVKKA
jgi:High potential iron-sulfur protein